MAKLKLVINETTASQTAKDIATAACEKHGIELDIRDASPDENGERPEWSKAWYSFPRAIFKHGEKVVLALIDDECMDAEQFDRAAAAVVSTDPELANV